MTQLQDKTTQLEARTYNLSTEQKPLDVMLSWVQEVLHRNAQVQYLGQAVWIHRNNNECLGLELPTDVPFTEILTGLTLLDDRRGHQPANITKKELAKYFPTAYQTLRNPQLSQSRSQ